jgi:hypothetical protein
MELSVFTSVPRPLVVEESEKRQQSKKKYIMCIRFVIVGTGVHFQELAYILIYC